jgi:hypothetical protein
MIKKSYYFVSSSDKLYYVSIYGSRCTIVNIDNNIVTEFISRKKLSVDKINEIINNMEKLSNHELVVDKLKNIIDAETIWVYHYEPKKIKVSEEARG